MTHTTRELWQLLLATRVGNVMLTCDECFTVLEYLADAVANGADPQLLRRALRRHLARCPPCHAHHLRRLADLEVWCAERRSEGP